MSSTNHFSQTFGSFLSPAGSSSTNVFLPNPSPGDAHLHATLQQIDELANDVEMQSPPREELTYLVLDTNILLHEFEVIQQFTTDVEAQAFPVMIIIPGAVIYELDGQKNRDGLAWFARRASAWLLRKVKERKYVKGQAQEETCKASGNWKTRVPGEAFGSERTNDGLIYDCCRYFSRKGRVFLCSSDRILSVECETVGISTIQAPPQPSRWHSRDIARTIFGDEVNLSKFGVYHPSYRLESKSRVTATTLHDDDGMDVDDESPCSTSHPSHPLDLLHIQIIDHFTRLLVELVGRVGGPEIRRKPTGGVGLSRYAPGYTQKDFLQWTAPDCLEYLDMKKSRASTNPRLETFLTLPYTGPGARNGQLWGTQDWNIALRALAGVGETWQEPSIRESLDGLRPHLEATFATRMRPTGT